ncbi:hypothetical protein GQ53DRAFT_132760 [Thozetella sp. PMI_491]|nr:hypothetical protein GQ53DRAFT_132760 [Thozetella sp. PMI_491]
MRGDAGEPRGARSFSFFLFFFFWLYPQPDSHINSGAEVGGDLGLSLIIGETGGLARTDYCTQWIGSLGPGRVASDSLFSLLTCTVSSELPNALLLT